MPDEEHLAAIKHTVEKAAGRITVIAGTGSNDTAHAIELSKKAEEYGVDGILSVTPYYNKTTQKGLIAHFTAIANAIKIPCYPLQRSVKNRYELCYRHSKGTCKG